MEPPEGPDAFAASVVGDGGNDFGGGGHAYMSGSILSSVPNPPPEQKKSQALFCSRNQCFNLKIEF